MSSSVSVGLVCLALLAGTHLDALGADGMDKPGLLELIRASEAAYKTVQFEGAWHLFKVDPQGRRFTSESIQHYEAKVRLTLPPGGRYYLETEGDVEGVLNSPQGGRPQRKIMPHRSICAYNGEVGTGLGFIHTGTGEWRIGSGSVQRERDRQNACSMLELMFFPALAPFYKSQGLSSYLEANEDWEIVSRKGDVIEIRADLRDHPSIELIRLDLSKGASIVGMQQWYDYGKKNAILGRDVKVELTRDQDLWIPKRAVDHRCGYNRSLGKSVPHREYAVTYESFRCNLPLDDKAFTVRFPSGTRVNDEVAGVQYVVGMADEGRGEWLDSAVAALADSARKAASTSPPTRSGPSAEAATKASSSSPDVQAEAPSGAARWWLPATAVVVLGVIGVVVTVKRKRQES